MKNKYILVLAALTLLLASCSDYLDRVPLDKNSDATNWTSEGALESYAWYMYNNFTSYSYGSSWTRGQYLSETMSDDYCATDFTQPTQTLYSSSSVWNASYVEIRRANILLNRVDVVPNLSDEAANHWRGVARFFRAMQHFDLVKTFGDVPWVDTEIDIDDAEALSKPRNPRAEVMKNVCADLEFAGKNCRYTTDNTVNNMVAWAFLSRVALYEAAWQRYHGISDADAQYFYKVAKDAAAEVINSGKYSIHNDYLSNYISKSLVDNTEMIMFKVYSHISEGAKVSYAHAMQGLAGSSSKAWGLTKSAVENFAMSNGLPIHMGTYSDETIEDVVKDRDARLSMIIDPEILCIPYYAYTEGVNSSTGYYVDKLVDWNDYGTDTWKAPYNTTDGPVFTYSEVLLNYAEACAELGAITQEDLDKSVNVLREKHGNIPALTLEGKDGVSVDGTVITADPKNKTGINVLLWELRRERRSELMGDGFRYEDLMRWKLGDLLDFSKNPECYMGVNIKALDAFYEKHKDEAQYKEQKYEDAKAALDLDPTGKYMSAYDISIVNRKFEDKNYLEPIPTTQITLNPNLTQNPGW